jgi:hypothetical protein
MSGTRLTVTMIGSEESHGKVRFDEFFRFCETVYKCLRASEEIVSGEGATIEYRIANLKYGSATVELEAVRKGKPKRGDRRAKVIDYFRKTVSNLQRGKIDPRIPPDDLGTFRELAAPLGRNVKRIVIGRTSLTKRFDETIGKLLDESLSSEGAVTGVLERLNVHDERNEFVIYPHDSAEQITCLFPESLLESVRKAIKRTVTVTGTQFYRHGSALPYRIHATAIEIHEDDSELPSLHDVRALGKWDTGGLTAVDFLRAIRNEQA